MKSLEEKIDQLEEALHKNFGEPVFFKEDTKQFIIKSPYFKEQVLTSFLNDDLKVFIMLPVDLMKKVTDFYYDLSLEEKGGGMVLADTPEAVVEKLNKMGFKDDTQKTCDPVRLEEDMEESPVIYAVLTLHQFDEEEDKEQQGVAVSFRWGKSFEPQVIVRAYIYRGKRNSHQAVKEIESSFFINELIRENIIQDPKEETG